jgi:hypothetical protein
MNRSPWIASIVVATAILTTALTAGVTSRAAGAGAQDAAAAQACGRGCQTFTLQMTFVQRRPWTRHYQQVSDTDPICIRTEDGNGNDEVKMSGKGVAFVPRTGAPSATLNGATGMETRSGTETWNLSGASCTPSSVFPSTWSIVTQIDGSVTGRAPTTGCGSRPIVKFPTLSLSGSTLRVRWTSSGKVPEFTSCPFFDGASEASDGNMLPKGDVFDVSAKVDLRALRNVAKRRITASGVMRLGATETCANLQQPCPTGVTYSATGSVEGTVTFVFVRKRK